MRHVYAEFLTTDSVSPEAYGDSGTLLSGLRQFPSVLRHEKYDDDCWHRIQLFARDPELFAQVWLSVYPEPAGGPALEQELKSYDKQRSNFRMPRGVKFTPEALLPEATRGFDIVHPFRVRDNQRLRVVQAFRGRRRSLLLVASRNDSDFLTSKFLRATLDGLSLADTPLEGPFGEGSNHPPRRDLREELTGRRTGELGQSMAKISEFKATTDVRSALAGSSREALGALGIQAGAAPKSIVEAIDQFVFDWQDGKRPPAGTFDEPDDVPVALGSLWGDQLVRQFAWEWVMIAFGKNTDDLAPAVVSPDRSLVVYPIHFLTGALADPGVDVTVALSFNMLEAGSVGKPKAKGYLNLMDGVRRIVPRR